MFTSNEFEKRYEVPLDDSALEIVDFGSLGLEKPVPSTFLVARAISSSAIGLILAEFGYPRETVFEGLCASYRYQDDPKETTRAEKTPVSMRVDAILRVSAKIANRRKGLVESQDIKVLPRDIFIAAISSSGIISTLFESYGTDKRNILIDAYTAPRRVA